MTRSGGARLLAEPLARRGRRPAPDPGTARRRRPRARARANGSRSCRGRSRSRRWSCCAIRARRTCCATPAATTRSRGSSRSIPETLEPVVRSPDLPGGPTWPGGTGRARERIALRRVRPARPPPRPGHGADRDATAPTQPSVQQLRDPARRPPRDQGLRRHASRAGPDRRPIRPSSSSSNPTRSRSSLASHCPNGRSRGSPRTGTTSTSSATRRCSACGGTAPRASLELDDGFQPRYRHLDGQGYGWDAVIDAGAAWFLDNGNGSERYAGSFRGLGISGAPLHLVRVDLATGAVTLTEICGRPNGIVANPPVVDPERGIAVGLRQQQRRARRVLDHGRRRARAALVAGPAPRVAHDPVPRHRRARHRGLRPRAVRRPGRRPRHRDRRPRRPGRTRPARSSPWCSRAAGFGRDLYLCSFSTLTRVTVA